MKFTTIEKQSMHKRFSYDELLDSILNPKDKIALPNRRASQLRKLQQLSQYDDESFINLSEEQQNIAKEKLQQMNIQNLAQNTPLSISVTKSRKRTSSLQPQRQSSLYNPFHAYQNKFYPASSADESTRAPTSAAASLPSTDTEKETKHIKSQKFIQFSKDIDKHLEEEKPLMEDIIDLSERVDKDKRARIATSSQESLKSTKSVTSDIVKSDSPTQSQTVPRPQRSRSPTRERKKKETNEPSVKQIEADTAIKREGSEAEKPNVKKSKNVQVPPPLPLPPPTKDKSAASAAAASSSKEDKSAAAAAAASSSKDVKSELSPPKKKSKQTINRDPSAPPPNTRNKTIDIDNPPQKAGLQVMWEILQTANNRNKLDKADAIKVSEYANKKPGRGRGKQSFNDEIRDIYERYYNKVINGT